MNLVDDQKGDVLPGSHNILNRCKNYFPQLLNLRRVGKVRHMETHAVEPLVLEPSHPETETAIAKLKGTNSQTLIKFQPNTFKHKLEHCVMRSINSFIFFGIRNNYLSSGKGLLLYQFTR
jgi:hypothetical protein